VFYVLAIGRKYVTFAWMTWELTQSPLYLGYLGLAQGAPLVVFQLLAGFLADRTSRLRLLLGTTIMTSATADRRLRVDGTGGRARAHLLVLAALAAPSARSMSRKSHVAGAQLIDRAQLPNAIALGSIPWQTGRMIGPSSPGS